MTELSFLLSLLLDYKLTKQVQQYIKERIRTIDGTPYQSNTNHIPASQKNPQDTKGQSASTIALLEKHSLPIPEIQSIEVASASTPVPTDQIAKTAAAAQALNRRQEALAIAQSGKEEKGRTSPRKW